MLAEARKAIAKAQNVDRAALDADEDLAAAFAWRLSLIGEAAARLSQGTRDRWANVPWTQIIGMRHRLIHGYDAVDLDVVWQTLRVDLPPLVAALEAILRSS
jgi:uncharacterized protein with HEPN domain